MVTESAEDLCHLPISRVDWRFAISPQDDRHLAIGSEFELGYHILMFAVYLSHEARYNQIHDDAVH
jgi:hypothetical protein